MNTVWKMAAIGFGLLLLSGCAAHIDDYADSTPTLKLEEFFNGPLVAYGMVQDRSGKVTQRFEVEMVGTWEGNEGVLDEQFVWDDGREQERIWYITKVGENRYNGRASDVEGVAEGTVQGHALHWVYKLQVPVGERTLSITLDDWMYLLDEQRLLNKTEMRYFGFRVGEITLYIERKL